jgi:hypothetical protein
MTPQVFISYSRQDEEWKERIQAHLNVLAKQGLLSIWDDGQIAGGQEWDHEIQQAIAQCDVALLLVSMPFLNSEYILTKEVPALLERRSREGIRVVPVILSPCAWEHVPWLKGMQVLPKGGKALLRMGKDEAEEAMTSLAVDIAGLRVKVPPKSPIGHPFPPVLRKLAYALLVAVMAVTVAWNPVSAWFRQHPPHRRLCAASMRRSSSPPSLPPGGARAAGRSPRQISSVGAISAKRWPTARATFKPP